MNPEETHLLKTPPINDIPQGSDVDEAKHITNMAWPVVIANIFNFIINISSIFSLGHLGSKYLAGSALATMLLNVAGQAVAQGLI